MMTIERSQLFLASFVALVAWGLAVRLVPVLRHIANAFFLGLATALLLLFFLILTTSRQIATRTHITRRAEVLETAPFWPPDGEVRDSAVEQL